MCTYYPHIHYCTYIYETYDLHDCGHILQYMYVVLKQNLYWLLLESNIFYINILYYNNSKLRIYVMIWLSTTCFYLHFPCCQHLHGLQWISLCYKNSSNTTTQITILTCFKIHIGILKILPSVHVGREFLFCFQNELCNLTWFICNSIVFLIFLSL